jgi:hypothetical protein
VFNSFYLIYDSLVVLKFDFKSKYFKSHIAYSYYHHKTAETGNG